MFEFEIIFQNFERAPFVNGLGYAHGFVRQHVEIIVRKRRVLLREQCEFAHVRVAFYRVNRLVPLSMHVDGYVRLWQIQILFLAEKHCLAYGFGLTLSNVLRILASQSSNENRIFQRFFAAEFAHVVLLCDSRRATVDFDGNLLEKQFLAIESFDFHVQNAFLRGNIIVENDHEVEVTFDYEEYDNLETIFSSTQDVTNAPHLTTYANQYYAGLGTSEKAFGTTTTGKHTFIRNRNGKCIFDGEEISGLTLVDYPGAGTYYYTLGCRGTKTYPFKGKIYSFIIRSNSTGEVLHNFIPVVCAGTSFGAMYDTITNKSYNVSNAITAEVD